MHSVKKILIISHDANLNGAPILLIRLMKILREHGYTFNTILRNGGPLANRFKALSDVFGYFKEPSRKSLLSKLNKRLRGREKTFDWEGYIKGVDLVLNNTITNGAILHVIKKNYDGPVITHIHELHMGEALYTSPALVNMTLRVSKYFLVPSDAVKRHIEKTYSIPNDSVSCLNYYVPSSSSTLANEEAKLVLINNNITASFIVGGIGTPGWRKGTDIFLQVAAEVFKKLSDADIQFVWMGAHAADIEARKMRYDIEKLGFDKKIVLLDASLDTAPFFKSIHILLLPSREDAYPLVMLEAAAEKAPTICFENSGGAPEFICPDAGAVVPYLDIEAMADAVFNYYKHNELINFHGEAASEKVKRLHQDERLVIKQFNDAILKLF